MRIVKPAEESTTSVHILETVWLTNQDGFAIDDNIDEPPSGRIRWPFKMLEIGESFPIPPILFRRGMSAAHEYNARMVEQLSRRRIRIRIMPDRSVRGFCIDVSNRVPKSLPYHLLPPPNNDVR